MITFDIEADIARLKAEGKWTKCHELGHDLKSEENMICKRCGEDFNAAVADVVAYFEGRCNCLMTAGGILHKDCAEYTNDGKKKIQNEKRQNS